MRRPDFNYYKDFEEPDIFIKECERFRFYMGITPKEEIQLGDPYDDKIPKSSRYLEIAEYAIDKFISDNDLCGYSDTDKSVFIYTLLSQALEIIEKKKEGE